MKKKSNEKTSIKIPRGKLAFLYEITRPFTNKKFSKEKCYVRIKNRHLRFAGMMPVLAFEYKIFKSKNQSLENIEEKSNTEEDNFTCNIEELNTVLSPFSKKTGSDPIKKSEETVFFDVNKVNGECKFREEHMDFSGKPLDILEKDNKDVWHPLPDFEDYQQIFGKNFEITIKRISATLESKIKLFSENKKVFLESRAGKQKLGKIKKKNNFSFCLPRDQLEKASSLLSDLDKFKIGIKSSNLILMGKDKKSTLKILLSKINEENN